MPRRSSSNNIKNLKRKKSGVKNSNKDGKKKASQGGSGADKNKNRKKKQKEEVTFTDPSPTVALPNGLKLYCQHTGMWMEVSVLEKKAITDQSVRVNTSVNGDLMLHPSGLDYGAHPWVYYVHFLRWDRRMDEWVTRDRLCLKNQMEEILKGLAAEEDEEEDVEEEEKAPAQQQPSQPGAGYSGGGNAGAGGIRRRINLDQGGVNPHHSEHGAIDGHGNFTEEEVKRHEEATKVKNIDTIVLGKHEITTWYYSPFPEEYNQYKTLYFCEYCLCFFGHKSELERHLQRCSLKHPPGNEIYRSDEQNVTVSVWEVDGAKETDYCQNLSYIAKLFLDHKTLEYDCTPFLYYIFTEMDHRGCHIVGYFSKEKVSLANYNLACILCLPCHQRKGYGKFIISLSYELSKVEKKVGSPEKPISDLGMMGYMSYWSGVLVKLLREEHEKARIEKRSVSFSIEEISRLTSITTEDIVHTLKKLKVLVWYKGKWVFSNSQLEAVLQERAAKAAARVIDPNAIMVRPATADKLHWTPYILNKPKK